MTPTEKRLRLPLKTANDVAAELARVYRRARSEELDAQTASRLANILQILARLIETSDLEKRIEALEGAQCR